MWEIKLSGVGGSAYEIQVLQWPKWMLLTWSFFYIFTQISSVHHCYWYYTVEERLSHAAHVNSVHVRSLTPVMLLVMFTCDCWSRIWPSVRVSWRNMPWLAFYSLGLCWINGFVITAPIKETFEKTSGTAWICKFTFQHVNIHSLFHNAYMCNSVLLSQWRCRKDTRETTVSWELSIDCEEIYTF